MLTITFLSLQRFRNLTSVEIDTSARFNLFFGNNGAGKTSLLEAIHYLGTGRSFRMHLSQPMLQYQSESFAVFVKVAESNRLIPLGAERYQNGQRQLRLDSESISSWAPLARQLPLRVLSPMSYRFLLDGPKVRRQFLDWTVFHVEQSFLSVWHQWQRALKQRNAALKARAPKSEILFWEETLVSTANQIDIYRSEVLKVFEPSFQAMMAELLPTVALRLDYYRGWDASQALDRILAADFYRDLQFGFTHSGPHRADLRLTTEGFPAQEVLSQGQQKIVAYALHLAQGQLLQQRLGKSPIYLIDDLAAELDLEKCHRVIALLNHLKSQVFITGTSVENLVSFIPSHETALFHVEHGSIQP